LAEGIFKEIINNNKLGHMFEIDSAGTSSLHEGQFPDLRTLKNAKLHGLNLTHKSRPFVQNDFYNFDYIIVMDDSNLKNVNNLLPNNDLEFKLLKMRFFDEINTNSDVPDPWFGGEKGFEDVYQILKRCCQNLYISLSQKGD